MSRGTPITLKCPKCKRGQFGEPRAELGCRPTGIVGPRIVKSNHSGHGDGGGAFYGYPGEVKCLDCGHSWLSTHPRSGRSASR